FAIGIALGIAVAAGFAFAVLPRPESTTKGPTPSSPQGLEATVEAITRGGSGGHGLMVSRVGGAGIPGDVGASVPAGSTLRTDDRTRARIRLSDGSLLSLQQGTELTLVADAPRTVQLVRGETYAEIAHLAAGPHARLLAPGGLVEVLGTKLLLSATGGRTSVRVTQGVVEVEGHAERVAVKAGEEALLTDGRPPVVMPAVGLGASLAWTELDGPAEEEDLPVPGLGELRARRPGEREESERPLRLAHHAVKVRIAGNVARTEIEESFQNDGPDTLEGIYSFPLPADARIASLSLEVDGRWEEGAFVARDRAKRIWRGVIRNATPEIERRTTEEFIWVPGPWHDPALLEWQQGGRFELRIFPIPPRGARRIRIAYEQTVTPHGHGRRYVYPLPHARTSGIDVGRFEADVRVADASRVEPSGYALEAQAEGKAQRLTFASDSFQPSGALIVDYEHSGDEAALRYWSFSGSASAAPPERTREQDAAVLSEHARLHADARPYVAFALRPELPEWSATRPRDYLLVVDSSQSMIGERYARAVRLAEATIEELDPRDRIAVMACDIACRSPMAFESPNAASAARAAAFLRQESPAGASNVSAAIREAISVGARLGEAGRALHVIYIGDGVASIGPRRAGSIAAEIREARRGASITTVGIGQEADTLTLAAIAREGGGHFIPYVPGERTRETALGLLETTYGASVEGLALKLPEGLTDVAPRELPNLRAGEEVWFVGRISGPVEGDLRVTGRIAGEAWEARYPIDVRPTTAAGNAFVPRLWASARIADLELGGSGEDIAHVVALSKAFHVMSRHTSLLVLESEAMFRAFGVD
ncbi:MAG: FecR domain-containing protein, partial [Polyangiaceae bacterium]|nr:FecR domain-containing protein [Polyangiaceae bacterium]